MIMNQTEIYKVWRETKELKHANRNLDLELARRLLFLKRENRYRHITGDPRSTWGEFLSDPELQISWEKARRIMRIYEVYIEGYGLKDEEINGIDQRSLLKLSTIIDKDNVRDWLLKAKNLSRSDLKRELKFGDIDVMTCKHNYSKTHETMECSKCGEINKIKVNSVK